jgi:elongation factor Ts
MTITAEQVKNLRDRTGVSVIQCKKALEEARGDIEKAIAILRKKSGSIADKKAGRELKAGAVQAYVHSTGDVGAMVALSCETDFVAKNREFVSLAYDIAMHVAALNPLHLKKDDADSDVPQDRILLDQEFIKNPEHTIKNMIESAVQKFGEKIEITDFVRFSVR